MSDSIIETLRALQELTAELRTLADEIVVREKTEVEKAKKKVTDGGGKCTKKIAPDH